MGSHLCKTLVDLGHSVVCTSRQKRPCMNGVSFTVGDAKNQEFLNTLLSERWDAIVDFMIWSTDEFRERYEGFLRVTNQYIFTSSYRVYADSPIIREDSPRLLDVVKDTNYLSTDEYALRKARCEDMLFRSGKSNWTVVRPAITYDGACGRLQLGVFESNDWLWRAKNGLLIPIPREMLAKQATMSYGGDVAKLIALLVGNSAALGESFTVSGSDHMTWNEVVSAYAKVLPFEVMGCDLAMFERVRGGVYQIRYDRMFDRVVDNSKVLTVTGMKPSDMTGMADGLTRELKVYLSKEPQLQLSAGFQGKMDKLCGGIPSAGLVMREGGPVAAAKYFVRRLT